MFINNAGLWVQCGLCDVAYAARSTANEFGLENAAAISQWGSAAQDEGQELCRLIYTLTITAPFRGR